jgi:predicted transcriptional regulator
VEAWKQVGDLVVPVDRYPSVRDHTTLREAIEVIESAQLEVELRKSLPRVLLVFDEINVLVGTLRRRDIMRGLEPKFLSSQPLDYRKKLFDVELDPNLSELPYDRLLRGIQEQAKRPVSDVMRPIEAILQADDHYMKAMYEMVSGNLSLIPVIQDEQLVGVLRSVDLFHEMAKLVR